MMMEKLQRRHNTCTKDSFLPLVMEDNERTRALHSSEMETSIQKSLQTQTLFHWVHSDNSSSHQPSDSAVSALQSKVKEISQRRSKEKGKHDVEGSLEPLQNKSDQEQPSLSQASLTEVVKSRRNAADASEAQFQVHASSHLSDTSEKAGKSVGVMSLARGHGEGSSLENLTKCGVAPSKHTSSPRYWKPPKGFWKETQLETRLLNGRVDSGVNNVALTVEEEIRNGQKPMVHEGAQGPDNKETDGQRKVKSKFKATSPARAERQDQTPGLTQKGLPPSYKETDWDSVANGSAFTIRSDLILSPRHEQAKRLLERARSKARSQNNTSDLKSAPQSTQGEELEAVPMHDPPTLVNENTQKPLPIKVQDVRSKTNEPGVQVPRQDQSPSCGRSEGESQKEPERCYSTTIQTNDAEPTEMTSHKDEFRKCEACGSILGTNNAKESFSTPRTERQEKSTTQSVPAGQSGHQIIRPALLGRVTLGGSSSLEDNVEVSGASGAGEGASAFGKLRRRSRVGENRAEASHGPYVRGQELLAQRRNSRTRSSLDETAGPLSKQKEAPTRGVTFAIDHSLPAFAGSRNNNGGLQLPIKSALKSGSKNRPMGQRVVKLLPSVQYHLIHQDKEGKAGSQHPESERQEQFSMPFGASSQASQVTSGLGTCLKPCSLRYASHAAIPELQAPAMWNTVDPGDAHSSSEDVCRDSICAPSCPCRVSSRGAGISKAEDLRAELLRSEHRKAELQWDEHFSRRTLERDGKPKLSLRHFFSAMGLNSMGKLVKGSRSSSMEQLSMSTSRASPSPTHKGLAALQRTPSLQALYTESPLTQLRKVSSVQSLQSPKRKNEHSAVLGELSLPLSLGSRDIKLKEGQDKPEGSRGSGPLGRLVQTFSDGTLLVELSRPVNAHFGFVISRGKGRPDSGIYVEKVGGSSTENIYTSLLGVGDEILEVNGEMVAGLSLDQVISLMTHESTATIRILPHRWIQH